MGPVLSSLNAFPEGIELDLVLSIMLAEAALLFNL